MIKTIPKKKKRKKAKWLSEDALQITESRSEGKGEKERYTHLKAEFQREVMTNLDSILKSRDITLSIKVRLVKAVVFPVVMYGCESWTIKKAERQNIDAFELWCWRRLLRVPWTTRSQTSPS